MAPTPGPLRLHLVSQILRCSSRAGPSWQTGPQVPAPSNISTSFERTSISITHQFVNTSSVPDVSLNTKKETERIPRTNFLCNLLLNSDVSLLTCTIKLLKAFFSPRISILFFHKQSWQVAEARTQVRSTKRVGAVQLEQEVVEWQQDSRGDQ